MASFVIIGTPRTGTTMLVNTLNNAQNFTVLGEICTPKIGMDIKKKHWDDVVQEQRKKRIKYHITTWMKKNNKGDTINKLIVFEYLDHIFSLDKNVGFKLLYPHMQKIPSVVKYIKQRNIKCIHLFREKKLKQAVSLQKKKVNKWSGKFNVNINSLKNRVEKLNEQEKWIEDTFENHPCIRLSYENITNDEYISVLPNNIQKDIFNFLDIKENLDIPLKVFTKRNAPSRLKDRLKNYDEVMKNFKN